MIEFTAADSEADGMVVGGFHLPMATEHSRAKSRDRLTGTLAAVVVDVDARAGEHLRRNPPGAHFVAWKYRPIHDGDVEAALAELPRAGRTRRAAADDEHVARVHTGRSGAR